MFLGLEGLIVADGLEVHGKDGVTIVQAGAGGTREPGGGRRTMVLVGTKGGRSQVGAGGSTGQGGVSGPEAEARAMGAISLEDPRQIHTLEWGNRRCQGTGGSQQRQG